MAAERQYDIEYNATYTASEFHSDDSFFRLLKGPVGCGKTVSAEQEIMRRAMEQPRGVDGIRYSRWAVIRSTYRQLKTTTIKTWLDWFPEKVFGKIKWDSPITHHVRFRDVDLEVFFMPLEGQADISNMRSLELTGVYINELQYLPYAVLKACIERCNRYPSMSLCPTPGYSGVIADTNPPDTDHWIYKLEKDIPSNYKYFHYKSALSVAYEQPTSGEWARSLNGTIYVPNKEAWDYVKYHKTGYKYFLNQVPGLRDEEIKVNLMGDYGFIAHGKPVYPEYNEAIHFHHQPVRYNRHENLVISWDFGLTPAMGVYQQQPNGRIIKLFEVTSDGFGIDKFATSHALPALNAKCPGWQNDYTSTADPAGKQGSQQVHGETCIGVLNRLGIRTQPAKSNDLDIRIGAVSWFLRRNIDGKGSFMITPECPQTRKGFLGDYQFEKKMITDLEEGTKALPLKNFSSHAHDETQYAMMIFRDRTERNIRPVKSSLSTRIN